jgi:hypothetical protein
VLLLVGKGEVVGEVILRVWEDNEKMLVITELLVVEFLESTDVETVGVVHRVHRLMGVTEVRQEVVGQQEEVVLLREVLVAQEQEEKYESGHGRR